MPQEVILTENPYDNPWYGESARHRGSSGVGSAQEAQEPGV